MVTLSLVAVVLDIVLLCLAPSPPHCGCARGVRRRRLGAAPVVRQYLGDLDPASLARGQDASAHDRKGSRRILAADLRRSLSAGSRREFLELLHEGIVGRKRNRRR